MGALFELWINMAVNHESVVKDILPEHDRILGAVLDRDPERSAASMATHPDRAAERLLSVTGRGASMADYISLLLAHSGRNGR